MREWSGKRAGPGPAADSKVGRAVSTVGAVAELKMPSLKTPCTAQILQEAIQMKP